MSAKAKATGWAGPVLALAAVVPGQEPPAPPAGGGEAGGGRITLNEVVAVVGGRLVWRSEVQQEYDARVSGIVSGADGVVLTEQQKDQYWTEELQRIIRDKMLAQGAPTLGFATPEEVQQYMDNFALQKEKELIRDAGSIDSVIEELELQGMSWDSYMAREREKRLTELAQNETVARRLDGKAALFVTKQEMREFYEAQKSFFVHGPRSRLEVVVFRGTSAASRLIGNGSNGNGSNGGSHGTTPAARALAASQAWADGGDVSADEIAERFTGIVHQGPAPLGWDFSTEQQGDDRKPFLRNFALGNPLGAVSDPQPVGETWWVLRVADRLEASNLPFENRDVQTFILERLQGLVIGRLRTETFLRSQNRTYLWPNPESLSQIRR